MSVFGPGDSVHVDVSTSVDFSKFYCSPTIANDLGKYANYSINHSNFLYANPVIGLFGLKAWYYITTIKHKSGITTIEYDTLYNVSGFRHEIVW